MDIYGSFTRLCHVNMFTPVKYMDSTMSHVFTERLHHPNSRNSLKIRENKIKIKIQKELLKANSVLTNFYIRLTARNKRLSLYWLKMSYKLVYLEKECFPKTPPRNVINHKVWVV